MTAKPTVCIISLAFAISAGHVADIGSDGEQNHEVPDTSRVLQVVSSTSAQTSASFITVDENVLGHEIRALAPGMERHYFGLSWDEPRTDPSSGSTVSIVSGVFELK